MGKIIGIISIKGGVGKTSVVVALGAALANEFNKKVLLLDANFSAPNLALHLGLVNPEITMHHVLNDQAKADEAIYETEHGFHIMPGALQHRRINPFKLKDKIKHLRNYYDVILIDSSPVLNEEILSTMISSDELFVVTAPDFVTLSTTLRAVKLAKQKKTPIAGLIINKVYNKKFELSLEEIEDAANCNVLAVLTHDMTVLEALSKSIPSTMYKQTNSTIEYKKLAAAILGEEYKDPRFKSKLKRLFSKLPKQEINRTIFKNDPQRNSTRFM
ncbi:AAA family ATPase [Candidatus Woesearchaeota archaeon]|nr:AAA family ATPase [Candidatus Woesearchaeota archaeon]